MNKECIKILQKKRNLELECLGIEPVLYGNVCRFINRTAQVVIKDGAIKILDTNPEREAMRRKFVSINGLSTEIEKTYGIKRRLTQLMINEWLRESVILVNMGKDISNNWEFITFENNFKEKTDNYNF